MNQVAALENQQRKSVLVTMASRYGMEPQAFEATVRATCMKADKQGNEPSREEFAAFLLVAQEYGLNPLTKEIYAFPDRGGVQPIVSIDGWMNLINSHPQMDGMEFEDELDDKGKLVAVTCRIYRKDRGRPICVTEYMEECRRGTDPWKKWPNRMLRHKAAIQCARYAFGFSGIMEPDEYDRMKDVTPTGKTGAERMQERRTEAVQIENQEGFSLDHVNETTAQATGQEAPAEPNSEPETIDLEPVDAPPVQEESENPAPPEEAETPTVLVEFLTKLRMLGDIESIDKHKSEYSERLNQLSPEEKKEARAAIAACKKNVEGNE